MHANGPTATPILPVRDLETASDFYRRLGLQVDHFDAGYAIVVLAGRELLHLQTNTSLDAGSNPSSLYLNVRDVDAWHARWLDAGAPVGAVVDQPWGMREFSIDDPSGNTLRVGTNL